MSDLTKLFPVRTPLLRRTVGHVRAVDGASLTVQTAETVGLVGESGSGKSTLGRMALRLIEPTAGSVVLAGRKLGELSAAEMRIQRRHGQMIFQDPYSSLDPRASIADNVGEPLRTQFGLPRAERDRRVVELLETVRLNRSHLRRYPHEFSGGQLQRIALARALAVRPRIIIADEPVSSLDVSTQAQMLQLQHLGLRGHVQRAHRLVGDDDPGPHRQGSGQGDSLELPSRELVRVATKMAAVEPHRLQQLDHPPVPLGPGQAELGAQGLPDVVGDAGPRVQ